MSISFNNTKKKKGRMSYKASLYNNTIIFTLIITTIVINFHVRLFLI